MLSLIEFESHKPETNQKNVSPFEMHSSFEYICISVHQGQRHAGTQHSNAAWLTGWGRMDEVMLVSPIPLCLLHAVPLH